MTTSMTAFSRAESSLDGFRLTWEIRSVNHRYLDVSLKLPEDLRSMEDPCRQKINRSLGRGRVDAHLRLEKTGNALSPARINTDMMESLVATLDRIGKEHPGLEAARVTDVLRWPGMILEDDDADSGLGEAMLECLDTALTQLVNNRQREGERLAELVAERVAGCRSIAVMLRENLEDIQVRTMDKWRKKIERLAMEMDNERVAQEVALILTRNDVSEELDRMEVHLDEVSVMLASNEPAGRRLDFLMQELNREANTLGSKSVDQNMTDASIELKVLVDQMREQVQNIE